jgi:wobble nucleotide-excising tRNase
MIQSMKISDSATFVGNHEIRGLRRINFFFGSNGTGKTTISRGIAAGGSSRFLLKWEADLPLERVVYNKDFLESHFLEAEELKGIFTLGQEEINLAERVEKTRRTCDELREQIAKLTRTRDGDPSDGTFVGKKQERDVLDNKFKEDCWAVKVQHEKPYREALSGCHRKDKFRDRVLVEAANNKCASIEAVNLAERVAAVFGSNQQLTPEIPPPSFVKLIGYEASPILSKKVVGKKDVDVAAIIDKLGNSDWVKQGLRYFEQSPDKCPFCQQASPGSLGKDLEAYFDEAFLADTNAIAAMKSGYAKEAARVQECLAEVQRSNAGQLDVSVLGKECEVLALLLKGNLEHLQKKQDESSRVVALDGVAACSGAILRTIEAANDRIKAHNSMIACREVEGKKLEADVWRFLLDSGLADLVAGYEKQKDAVKKGTDALDKRIGAKRQELLDATKSLHELEKKTTSVQPTVDEINNVLSSFGFQGFSLAIGESKSTYKLVRRNGEPAKSTLSEGEKTFVTFLYFYHLLKGGKDATSVSASRVVVLDDPVSSLDSDVLHIVSSLIKRLFEDVCAGRGVIKQVFVMTHNNYFHKEVTYTGNMKLSINDVGYWRVKKQNGESSALFHRTNPVKTSYEMLWYEIANRDFSANTIQNTMRRILEQSARLLGGIALKDMENTFTGVELSACRTLMTWVHDGSHFCHDDICVSVDESGVETYLYVFRLIFERCGHEKHYRLMMKLE